MQENNIDSATPPQLSDKEVFLDSITSAYESENFSGYKFSNPTKTHGQVHLLEAFSVESPECKEGGSEVLWEVSLSILPSPSNLLAAAQALAIIAAKAGITFKSWIISANDGATLIPDGTTTTDPLQSDRDQRDKEFCFFLKFNARTQQFEMTPEQCKNFLLDIWATLIQKGLEFGYTTTTRIGEKAIPTGPGIETPFTLTANMSCQSRHGMLNQPHYNPLQFPNPLAGVSIDYPDLVSHGISLDKVKLMLEKRIGYLENHSKKSRVQWRSRVKQIASATQLDTAFHLPNVMQTLCESLNITPPFSAKAIKTVQQCIDQLLKHAPYNADNGKGIAAPFQVVADLAHLWNQIKTKNTIDNIAQLNRLLFDCEAQLTAEIKLLTAEFLKNEYCMEELFTLNITVSILESMCATHPKKMLVLYRNARLLENELKGLIIEKANLRRHNEERRKDIHAQEAVTQTLRQFYHYPWNPSLFTKNHTIELDNVIGSNGALLAKKTIKITPNAFKTIQLIQAAQNGKVRWADAWEKIKQDGPGLFGMAPPPPPTTSVRGSVMIYESLTDLCAPLDDNNSNKEASKLTKKRHG